MTTLTVSQINRYIKSVLEQDRKLTDLYIKGEISNFVRNFKSGHCYFSLKDENASIRAVMFQSNAGDLRFEPENGMSVLVRANIGVFERDGAYQLYVTDMQPDGAGALAVAFEQRKRKLLELGLFDSQYKKPLPPVPKRVGVITSQTGAALQDIVNIISRRYPVCELAVCPAQVQGDAAAKSLVNALRTLDEKSDCDVIIISRGGGSAEDLWCFNDESLAYAVFEAVTPVVSAVGHEVDYTICDFVADCRAPTPSAAAELVTPSIREISQNLLNYRVDMRQSAKLLLEQNMERLERLKISPGLASPKGYLLKNQQRLDFFSQSLYNRMDMDLKRFKQAFVSRANLLESLSPLKVLSRGYCVAFREGGPVLKASALEKGSIIDLRFYEGMAKACIMEVENEKKYEL